MQYEVSDDAVLELDLGEPLGVDGGELLLGLELVFDDAVHLRERVGLSHESDAALDSAGGSVGADRGCCGGGSLFEVGVLGCEGCSVRVGLGFGLADKRHAATLIEPRGNSAVEGSIATGGEDADLAATVGLRGFVLLHSGLAGGKLLLDLAALIAAGAGELLGGVGEFVAVELELGLGNVEIVGGCSCSVGLFEGSGEGIYLGLIFLDEALELLNFLLEGESFACEGACL